MKTSLEKSQTEHSHELKQLTREFEGRLKLIEEDLTKIEHERDQARDETGLVRRQLSNERSAHEEQLVELESRVREEETSKFNSIVRNLSLRLKQVEDSSEQLSRTNYEMQRSHETAEKRAMEQAIALEGQLDSLKEERADLQRHLSSLEVSEQGLRGELHRTRAALDQSNNEMEELGRLYHAKKEAFLFDLDRLNSERAAERSHFENKIEGFNSEIISLE